MVLTQKTLIGACWWRCWHWWGKGCVAVRLFALIVLFWGQFVFAQSLTSSSPTIELSSSAEQLWLGPGFYSHHFERHKNYRDNNTGVSIEWAVRGEWALLGGRFINSDHATSHYAGASYYPFSWALSGAPKERGWRIGLFAGIFDGYPNYRSGQVFFAALPMVSWRGEQLGINLSVVPAYKNRLHGAWVVQGLIRVW